MLLFELFVGMASALLAEHVRILAIITEMAVDRRMAVALIMEMTPKIDFEDHFRRLVESIQGTSSSEKLRDNTDNKKGQSED